MIFIGPDKCGSTWLFENLSSSGQVANSKIKDPFYFDQHYHLGVGWYDNLFQIKEATLARLDVSHDYLFCPEAAARIASDLPADSTHLILGVRDPIERALSSFRYMISQGRVDPFMDFGLALTHIGELLDHGDYGKNLPPWIATGMPISLLDFELLLDHPELLLRDVCHSIGIDVEMVTSDPFRVVNRARLARNPSLIRQGRRAAAAARRFGFTRSVQAVKGSMAIQSLLFSNKQLRQPAKQQLAEIGFQYGARIRGSLQSAGKQVPSPIWSRLAERYRE